MALPEEARRALERPLNPRRVKTRKQAGREVPFLEGHDLISKANEIFGFDGWSYRVPMMPKIIGEGTYVSDNQERPWALVLADVSVEVGECCREDFGLCVARPSDNADVLDMAYKGAVTDALKRALRTFGDQFGNSLYDKTADEGGAGPAPRQASSRTRAQTPRAAAPPKPQESREASRTAAQPAEDMWRHRAALNERYVAAKNALDNIWGQEARMRWVLSVAPDATSEPTPGQKRLDPAALTTVRMQELVDAMEAEVEKNSPPEEADAQSLEESYEGADA